MVLGRHKTKRTFVLRDGRFGGDGLTPEFAAMGGSLFAKASR